MKVFALPKLTLLDINPQTALITIGQTQDIKRRFNNYACAPEDLFHVKVLSSSMKHNH